MASTAFIASLPLSTSTRASFVPPKLPYRQAHVEVRKCWYLCGSQRDVDDTIARVNKTFAKVVWPAVSSEETRDVGREMLFELVSLAQSYRARAAEQAALTAEQATLTAEQATLAAEQAGLAAEQAALADGKASVIASLENTIAAKGETNAILKNQVEEKVLELENLKAQYTFSVNLRAKVEGLLKLKFKNTEHSKLSMTQLCQLYFEDLPDNYVKVAAENFDSTFDIEDVRDSGRDLYRELSHRVHNPLPPPSAKGFVIALQEKFSMMLTAMFLDLKVEKFQAYTENCEELLFTCLRGRFIKMEDDP